MDKKKYTKKCLSLLNTEQFCYLNGDPTKSRTTKTQITKQEYQILHPPGSYPGHFKRIAGLHKILSNDHVNQLPIRHTISDIGIATFKLAKHLSKITSPLQNSKYAIKNTDDFIEKVLKRSITK